MQIEISEIEPCKLAVHYEANFLEISDKRMEVQNSFKKAPVSGFRPGHASMDAIKMTYGKQIDEALKRALAEDAYHNTLFEKKLRPHGAPRFNNLLLDGGKFVCEFELYTKPEFELADWKGMEIPQPHETMNANMVLEQMLQEMRTKLGTAEPYGETDFVQNGDSIIVDYEASIDGVKIDNLSVTGEMMTIGQNPLKGFDDNFLGMTSGETREFDFDAPDGGLPSVSGKRVHFKVTVATGAKNIPCPLDDELAKKFGKKDYAELLDHVSQAASARVETNKKMRIHEAIGNKLVANTTIAVPNWMTLSEAQYLSAQAQMDWNVMQDADKEKMLHMAEGNVKLTLILDKVRELEPSAQLTDQEVFGIVKHNLAQSQQGVNLDEVIQQMNRTGYLQIMFSRIRDQNALDCISKQIKVIE